MPLLFVYIYFIGATFTAGLVVSERNGEYVWLALIGWWLFLPYLLGAILSDCADHLHNHKGAK